MPSTTDNRLPGWRPLFTCACALLLAAPVLAGLWQGDTDQSRITTKVDRPMVGANLAAHLDGLRAQMRKAAENLEFEEAARLRDEVKRLEAVELAVADDPLARQSAVDDRWATVDPPGGKRPHLGVILD